MGNPRYETPIGQVGAGNVTFYARVPYTPGTVAVFVNGVLNQRDEVDGWIEVDPASGRVDLREAPLVGDHVQFFYVDTETLPIQDVSAQMVGVVRDVAMIRSALEDRWALAGRVLDVQPIAGVVDVTAMVGVVRDAVVLRGVLGC